MKQKVSFKAWDGHRYIPLAEILLVSGRFLLDLKWSIRVDEIAPGPDIGVFEGHGGANLVPTLQLLHQITPDIQIIDGQVSGFDTTQECRVLITAVDSTAWDFETDIPDLFSTISAHYGALSLPSP